MKGGCFLKNQIMEQSPQIRLPTLVYKDRSSAMLVMMPPPSQRCLEKATRQNFLPRLSCSNNSTPEPSCLLDILIDISIQGSVAEFQAVTILSKDVDGCASGVEQSLSILSLIRERTTRQ
jgi:hypothetical protein